MDFLNPGPASSRTLRNKVRQYDGIRRISDLMVTDLVIRDGRIAAIDGLASDPNVLWVGAATGGVWKSSNGGTTWTPVFDEQRVSSIGAVAIDQNARITSFEEKPTNPKSTLIGIALYYYPRTVLPEIDRYLDEGNNPDQPGRLIQWLYPQHAVHAWPVPGQWLDIGSRETLAEAQEIFGGRI